MVFLKTIIKHEKILSGLKVLKYTLLNNTKNEKNTHCH